MDATDHLQLLLLLLLPLLLRLPNMLLSYYYHAVARVTCMMKQHLSPKYMSGAFPGMVLQVNGHVRHLVTGGCVAGQGRWRKCLDRKHSSHLGYQHDLHASAVRPI
jgi:hypothetical protein